MAKNYRLELDLQEVRARARIFKKSLDYDLLRIYSVSTFVCSLLGHVVLALNENSSI